MALKVSTARKPYPVSRWTMKSLGLPQNGTADQRFQYVLMRHSGKSSAYTVDNAHQHFDSLLADRRANHRTMMIAKRVIKENPPTVFEGADAGTRFRMYNLRAILLEQEKLQRELSAAKGSQTSVIVAPEVGTPTPYNKQTGLSLYGATQRTAPPDYAALHREMKRLGRGKKKGPPEEKENHLRLQKRIKDQVVKPGFIRRGFQKTIGRHMVETSGRVSLFIILFLVILALGTLLLPAYLGTNKTRWQLAGEVIRGQTAVGSGGGGNSSGFTSNSDLFVPMGGNLIRPHSAGGNLP